MSKTSKRTKYKFLDSHLFDAFLVASETQNFTQAAQITHMTQAGVSQHIAKLESQLNQPLFKRIGKRVELTQVGEKLVEYIKEQKRLQHKFLSEIGHFAYNDKNVVKLGMPERFMFMKEIINFLNKLNDHDKLVLEIALMPSDEVVKKIQTEELNFGLISGFNIPPEIETQEFCEEEFVLTVGKDKRELYDQQFIKYPDSDEVYSYWLDKYSDAKERRLSFISAGRIRRVADAVDMVSDGLGSGVFPYHMVGEYIDSGKLFIPFNDVSITGKVCFAYDNKPGKEPLPILQRLIDESKITELIET